MLPCAEIYVHKDDSTKQIDGFIGLNNDYIEGRLAVLDNIEEI
jgi:hypothetical protein